MDYKLLLVCLFTLPSAALADDKKRGEECKTVNEKTGICLPLNQCQSIISKNATDFARKSCYSSVDETLVCCEKPSLVLSLEEEINNVLGIDICGISEHMETPKIYGGVVADIGEFPWLVGILYDSETYDNLGVMCMGSLINDEYVLTAAHCLVFVTRNFIPTSVRLGDWNLTTDPDCKELIANTYCAEPAQTVGIKATIPHPYYSSKYHNNDIGLIRLEKQVKFSEFISPICLPPPDLQDHAAGAKMTVAGWGLTEKGTSSDILLKADLPVVSEEACINATSIQSRPSHFSFSQICAGGDSNKDACSGDSGGPLMYAHDEKMYQRGVISWGRGCGVFPGVYTKVADYLTWIVNVVTKYK